MLAVAAETSRRRAAEAESRSLNAALEQMTAGEQVARRDAEDANRVKERFLATLSHELRTPLNAALGWTRVLLDLPPSDARLRRATQAINRNLLVQARLVADIIDVSRGSAGRLDLKRVRVDVRSIVNAAIDTVGETAAARKVSVQTTLPDAPIMTVGDAARLQQVVWNLLENAIKFSPGGGLVHVSVVREHESVEISVADDGPGVDPVFLPFVFDEFRQADESMTRSHGGLGLGLAIARRIVQEHGGTITGSNRPEGGALFTVRLPVDGPPA